MNERYAWGKMPKNYYADYYNLKDLSKKRTFTIIDNTTNKSYVFPEYETILETYGYNSNKIIFNKDLCNQYFFNWLCRTAPDFGIRDIPKIFQSPELIDIFINNSTKIEDLELIVDITQEQCNRFVRRLPAAINYVPKMYITKEFLDEIADIYPTILLYIKDPYLRTQICDKCYQKVDLDFKIIFITLGLMKYKLNSKMLEELVDNEKSLKKSLIYLRKLNGGLWDKIIEVPDIFNLKIVNKLLAYSSEFIEIIPEEFITLDIVKKALIDDAFNIKFVPGKYQTFDVQKIAIKKDYRSLKYIPAQYLTDKIILFALDINSFSLAHVPREKRKKEFCIVAVLKNKKVLRFVPDEYKTYEMCKSAVLIYPELIKYVTYKILTKRFLEELQMLHVIIPEKYQNHVKQCLSKNEQEEIDFKDKKETKQEIIENKNVESLQYYFTNKVLSYLNSKNIKTLGQLFTFVDKNKDNLSEETIAYKEIINTTKILRCKYYNEDPLINIEDVNLVSKDLYNLLGFSIRTSNALNRAYFCDNAQEFFTKFKNDTLEIELKNVKGLGMVSRMEIMKKVSIVMKYYLKNQSKSLEDLKRELENLKDLRILLDDKINLIKEEINMALANQEKRVLK